MSKKKSFIPVLALLMLLGNGWILAQEGEAGLPVAILVVDVFEVESEPLPLPENGQNCVVSPDGQDGAVIGGSITSAFSPLNPPHGRLVYSEIQALLSANNATKVSTTTGDSEFGLNEVADSSQVVPWMRDIEEWRMPDGGVISLVAIDTDGYTTEAIDTRIAKSIQLVTEGTGNTTHSEPFDRIVINMSFAIIPCGEILQLDLEAYIVMLEDTGFGTRDEICARIIGAEVANACNVLYANPNDHRDGFKELLNTEPVSQSTYREFYDNILQTFTLTSQEPVEDSLYSDYGSPELPFPFLEDDPLLRRFNSGEWCTTVTLESGNEEALILDVECIAVAAAGNEGRSFPYAPAIFNNVLSVSAEYEAYEGCETGSTSAANLRSNSGEIRENGVYNCLAGTSFAAPRIAFVMALHLAAGGQQSCDTPTGQTLTPPMAYGGWNDSTIQKDLELVVAQTQYCPGFLVTTPPVLLPTPTP